MFIHNINPVMFSIGSVEIRYYGLVYSLGFLAIYFLLRYYSKTKRMKLDYEEIDTLMIYLILGVIIGSRVFEMLFWETGAFLSNPLVIFYLWEGGMSFHGGLVGVIIAGYLFTRTHKIKFLELADILSIPSMLFLAIGRIANYINAELPGKITDLSWCVQFPGYEGCRHPYQIYSAAARFMIFGWLFYLGKKSFKAGFIFWNFLFFDGIARLVLDFYKDFDSLYLGLTAGQYLSIVMIVVSTYALFRYHKEDLKKIF